VFFVSFKIVDHGRCRGNTVRALAQWQHLVALHETTDVLHWAMRIAPYHRGSMGIKTRCQFACIFVIVESVVTHNHS
jgi:hypothetical protein